MKFLKKHKWKLLSFLLPFVFLLLTFYILGSFTKNNILNSDLHAQYVSLFQYLKNVLTGVADFPYTFSKGLGGGMYGTYLYYLASPFNFLVVFFNNIPNFLLFLIILKLSLCSFTMNIFLKYKFKKANKMTILVFSLLYTFIGYNINYMSNIMWLDGVFLAPLILLGIDKMINNEKSLVYIISLFLAILCNYYIGYMLCLFSVIYFFYNLFLKHDFKKDKKIMKSKSISFLITTVLIGLMTSFILVPSGIELLGIERVSKLSDMKFINLNFFDSIVSNYIGFGSIHDPRNFFGFNIYSGIVPLILAVLYFKNSKVSIKEKKLTGIVYLLLLLPVIFPIFNYVWHMFSIPESFNYRYSFLFSLFTLYIVLKSYINIEVNKRILISLFIVFLLLSSCLLYSVIAAPHYYIYLNSFKIITTVSLLFLCLILFMKKKYKLILVISLMEVMVSFCLIGYEAKDKLMSMDKYNDRYESLLKFSGNCSKNIRCERINSFTINDSLLGNYNGVTTFLTTNNHKPIKTLYKMGGVGTEHNYYIYANDVITNMLIGVKYIEFHDETYLDKLNSFLTKKENKIYTNKLALSLGYVVSSDIKKIDIKNAGFLYQQEILNALAGENGTYFKEILVTKINDLEYEANINTKFPYLYITSDKMPKIDGEELPIEKFSYISDNYAVIYNNYSGKVKLNFKNKQSQVKLYYLDIDKLTKLYKNLVNSQFNIKENKGSYITGEVNNQKKGVLFTTIPYEKGWSIKIDRKKVNYYEVIDSFIGMDLKQGKYKIEMKYQIPGLKTGVVISLLAIFSLIIYTKKVKPS
jgi:Predicted membrane protein